MINSTEDEIRQIGDEKWNEALKNYSNYFRSIQHYLSSRFINLYNKFEGFHDAPIMNITIKNIGNSKCIIEITLQLGYDFYILSYIKVNAYAFQVPQDRYWFGGLMHWGYGELEILDNGYWSHTILCEGNCEFNIICKKITVKKCILRK